MQRGRYLLPMRRIWLLTLVVMISMAGCDSDQNLPIYGTYTMDELIYHSSLNPETYEQKKTQLEGAQFIIKEKEFKVITPESTYENTKPSYETRKMEEELIDQFQKATSDMVAITDYKYKYQYEVYDDKAKTNYRIYLMDDELWIAAYTVTASGEETILDLIRLK